MWVRRREGTPPSEGWAASNIRPSQAEEDGTIMTEIPLPVISDQSLTEVGNPLTGAPKKKCNLQS